MRGDILSGLDVSRMAAKLAKREQKPAGDHQFKVVSSSNDGKTCTIMVGDNQVEADTGTSVYPGDIVTARWKDGRYTVVVNLTRPSTDDEYAVNAFGKLVRQVDEIRADTGRFSDLFAAEADVYVLVAENATIAQIEAANAKVEELEAQDLSVEKITATQATIDLLGADGIQATTVSADGATVKVLAATSAAVSSLDASIATIHDLRASVASIEQLDVESLTAATAVINQLDVAGLQAAAADISQLKADTAFINALTGKTLGVDELAAVTADIETLNAHALNADAAALAAASIKALLAQSGWFEEITVTGDATITGQLKSVLLDGDTARFKNIYANALKLLGPDGLYHALNFEGMDEALETVYTAVTPGGTENPSQEGWYEESGGEYSLSEATAVESGTTYYAASQRIADSDVRAFASRYGESLDGGLHGSHIIAETITADQIDATSVRAALLEVLNIVVGLRTGFHIEIESDTGGGSMNFVSGEKTVADRPWSYVNASGIDNQGNRIAYLQADNSGDSLFYMNKAVVMNDLRFARWQWKARSNGNLTLKWVG